MARTLSVHRLRAELSAIGFTLLASVISLIVIFPFLWVIFAALKTRREVVRDPLGLPVTWEWGNFGEAWDVGNFSTYFRNSVLVTLPTVAIILVLALLAAYAFTLMTFRGRDALFILFLSGMTIPLGVLIIPLFYEMRALNLLNTHWALILPQIAIGLPFSVLLLRSFIRELPQEIMDAALIDGCTRWQLLWRVVTPLTRPALLSLTVFHFMWTWNQFLLPVVLIQNDAVRTLPVGLNFFQGQYVTDTPLLMAGAAITFIPILIVYLIFQRQFINGISAGALK